MRVIRVLLADDHTLVRAGIRSLIASMPGIEVVGEAGEGNETLRLAADLRPDVVLLDIGMPNLGGLEVVARLVELNLGLRVLILSMHTSEEYVLQALRSGAGYLLKSSAVTELEEALRTTMRGEIFLSAAVSRSAMEAYSTRTGSRSAGLDALTQRQREIVRLVAEGLTSKQIAHQLGVSSRTVDSHRAHLMERLAVHDVAGLVRFAVRVGLIAPES